MAGEKEIRSKIASISNTQKITKAMEMVAASKMRKAQDRMAATRPYAMKIREVIGHLAHASAEYRHPFLEGREEVQGVGFIVVSTDRGLCGGLNINLFKTVLRAMHEWRQQQVPVRLCLFGAKGTAFFKRIGGIEIVAQTSHLGDAPRLEEVIGQVKIMLDDYIEGRIDRVYLAENEFVNTMTQTAEHLNTASDPPGRTGRTRTPLGLHLRARRTRSAGRVADALHRVAGVPRRDGKHRLRAWPRAWSR